MFALLALAAVASPDLSSLAWMAGTWTGRDGSVEMEEQWLPPRGGTLLGVHRDVDGGRTVSYEFLRIEAAGGGVVYWASPQGRPPTPFKLVSSAEGRVVFENAEHDYPRQISYWRDGAGLCARVAGTRKGKPASEEWCWRPAQR